MTFRPIADRPMPPNPPIQIFFHGLIILHSPTGTNWFAEPHYATDANDLHTLSVEVRMKEPNKPDMILLRHFDKLPGSDPGLTITVLRADNTQVPPVANKYVPVSSFLPINPVGEELKDFRWTINLEGLHKTPLQIKTAKTRPGIEIRGGTSFLHTALFKKGPIAVTQGENADQDPVASLPGLAGIVGANLYFEDGVKALVNCTAFSKPLELPKPPDGSPITYEIYINNNPLFVAPGDEHSEMKEYYKIVEKAGGDDILPNEQFELIIPPLSASELSQAVSSKFILIDLRASIRIPCMPTTLDGQ